MQLTKILLRSIISNEFQEEYLDLKGQDILDKDIDDLVNALQKNGFIKWINLTNNLLTSVGVQKLATLKTIKGLYLNENQVGVDGCRALACHAGLEVLCLGNNDLNDECAAVFTDNTTLKHLDVSMNKITAKGISHLMSMRLEYLTLAFNPIGNSGAEAILQSNQKRPISITDMNLIKCDISDVGAEKLAIIQSPFLKKLSLRSNKISQLGAKAFGYYNPALSSLGLSFNFINDDGAESLANIKSLMELDLDYNDIKNPSYLRELFLKKMPNLRYLSLETR